MFHFIPFRVLFVFLHGSYYFCRMISENDSSASGYITDSFEGISQTFTDVEILSTSDVNVVARAKRYGRWWLLKGLNKDVANEVGYQQRLRKELEILTALQHPNIVMTVGLEEVEGLGVCILMEYVEGITLKKWLQAEHTRKERRRIAMQLLEAVGYIHSKGIVHRDLKPENIIITTNGDHLKLIDFGLADTDSHTILKQPAGTEKYMSPEQMKTAVADVRNDIYSLGVIFSQMNLGYDSIILRCQKPIESRFQNISELVNAIRRRDKIKTKLGWGVFALLLIVLSFLVLAQSFKAKRVDDAIVNGKVVIDKAIQEAGVAQHLDTLQNLKYLRTDFLDRLQDGNHAYQQYLKEIGGEYFESELAEIANALMIYDGEQTKQIVTKYDQLKEAYDKAIEEGD